MQRDNVANGFRDIQEEHYDHCKVEGMLVINAPKASVKNTEFVQEDASFYNVYIKNSVPISFENCLFRCKGSSFKFDCGEAHCPTVTISNCQFIATSDNEPRPVFEMFTEGGMRGTLTITGSSHTGFVTKRYHKGWWKEWNRDTEKETNLYTGFLDGKHAVADGVWEYPSIYSAYEIDNAYGLLWLKEKLKTTQTPAITILFTEDIDMNDLLAPDAAEGSENWTGFSSQMRGCKIDGQGHTISNMVVHNGKGFINDIFKITIENICFDKAEVNNPDDNHIGVVIGSFWGGELVFNNVVVSNSQVRGKRAVGPLLGFCDEEETVTIKECQTIGNRIEGDCHLGGLIGYVHRQNTSQPVNNVVESCRVENHFTLNPASTYQLLNTTTVSGLGSNTYPGDHYPIVGVYEVKDNKYYGAYADYYVSGSKDRYEKDQSTSTLDGTTIPLANDEIVVNKDWQPVNTQ